MDDRLGELGYGEEHQYLRVCRNCARLWESEIGGRERQPAQQCTCAGPPDSWEGGDVSEWARLCDCCLRVVVGSGSRWSVWFCEDCKHRVMGLNAAVGLPLIPIGRHTLMHGITVHPDGPEIEVEEFVEAIGGLFDRIYRLGDWKEHRLAVVFDTLGLADGVPLVDYLTAVADSEHEELTKETSFTQLAAWFGAKDRRR